VSIRVVAEDPGVPPVDRDVLSELCAISSPGTVLEDPELLATYERDWSGTWVGRCSAVLRPASTQEAAAVLRVCSRHSIRVIPQGGRTGLVGGGTPRGPERQVVLSSERLTEVGEVDPLVGQVTVGAGVTLAALQRLAGDNGFDAGLDLGARDTATVGGIAACDAGGLQAIRDGTARRRIMGLEVVLSDGSVISRLGGLTKDNAGYNLPSLMVGSEGTLGFFTRIRWGFVDQRTSRATAMVGAASVEEAVRLAGCLRRRLASLEVLELMTGAALERACRHLSVPPPIPWTTACLLIQCAASRDPGDELLHSLEELDVGERSAFAVDARGRDRLFDLREALPEALAADRPTLRLDVGLPLGRLAEFHGRLERLCRETSGTRLIVFGHLGDGNLHLNIAGQRVRDAEMEEAVLKLVAQSGGTISAEHGVGVQKVAFLRLVRSDPELEAMRRVKRAFDPAGIMNPGVVLPER
jgi:FAD/FMN-containing dehydrogenase